MNTSFITLLTAKEAGRIIGFDKQLLLDLGLQLTSTLIIIFVMYKLLYGPMTAFLEKRKNSIAKEINDAKSAKVTAAELQSNYEEKLAKVEEEASKILKETRAKALAREEQILQEAKKEAESIREKALSDIKLEQERVQDEMKQQIIDLSTMMASKFVLVSMDEEKHNQINDEIIKEMGDVQWLS